MESFNYDERQRSEDARAGRIELGAECHGRPYRRRGQCRHRTLTGHVDNYSAKYTAEAAAGRVKAIIEELEVKPPGHVKKGDEAIAVAAVDRFSWSDSVPHNALKVRVEKGWVVTLTGEVNWHFEKDAAVREVRDLAGVIGVSDQITIKPRVNIATIGSGITHIGTTPKPSPCAPTAAR